MEKEILNMGKLIKEELKRQDQTIAWLARKISSDRSNFHKLLNKYDISHDKLQKISKILKHDFFKYYSTDLQKDTNEHNN